MSDIFPRSFENGPEVGTTAPSTPPQAGEVETLRAALEASVVAIDDWLHTYAYDLCNPSDVTESRERIGEYGTLAYIAMIQQANRAALATPSRDGGGE